MDITNDQETGLTIHFSNQDLVNMPSEDLTLLKLFVGALTEEFEHEMTSLEKKHAIEAAFGLQGLVH